MSKFEQLPISKIAQNPANPRLLLGDMEELAASISAHGILQPLLVRQKKGQGTDYELVDGHRRFNAATLAGLDQVPCIIEKTMRDVTQKALVMNLQRVDLTPYETAQGIADCLQAKIKQKALAASLGKSEAWLSKYATIAKAISKANDATRKSMQHELDGEKLYNLARSILGLDKPAGKQMDIEEETSEGGKGGGEPTPELEFIEEMKAALALLLPPGDYKVELQPDGTTGWTVMLRFKSENKLRGWAIPQK